MAGRDLLQLREKDTYKRVIAFMLACIMAFTMMPTPALALESLTAAANAEQTGDANGNAPEEQNPTDNIEGTTEAATEGATEATAEPTAETTTEATTEPATEPTAETVPPVDDSVRLTLKLKKWWIGTSEETVEADSQKCVDFSGYAQHAEEPAWAGATLESTPQPKKH